MCEEGCNNLPFLPQHGYCLSLLSAHLHPGMKVLDVGSGSGYLLAVMALLVRQHQKTSCSGGGGNGISCVSLLSVFFLLFLKQNLQC